MPKSMAEVAPQCASSLQLQHPYEWYNEPPPPTQQPQTITEAFGGSNNGPIYVGQLPPRRGSQFVHRFKYLLSSANPPSSKHAFQAYASNFVPHDQPNASFKVGQSSILYVNNFESYIVCNGSEEAGGSNRVDRESPTVEELVAASRSSALKSVKKS
jgi:hypothetical protein